MQRRHAADALTIEQSRAQLIQYLTMARSLDGVSAEQLAHRYRVPRREAEQRLKYELARREARG